MVFDNPHAVAPELDRILVPPPDVPGWSENINFCCHAGQGEYGIYAHGSRMHDDPSIWETAFALYLPDQELLVDRSFGRSRHEDEASSGQLTFVVQEPLERWSMRFDGMARRIDRATGAHSPVPDGDVELVQVDLTWDAASPVWSLGVAAGAAGNQPWASMHLEQAVRVRGTIRTRDGAIEMDHVGIRDHSAGQRYYDTLVGEAWASAALPDGRFFAALQVWSSGDVPTIAHGFYFDGEKMHDVAVVHVDPLTSTFGDPQDVRVCFDGPDGRVEVSARLQNSMAFTLPVPIGMVLGADMVAHDIFTVEGPAVYEWDGQRALGWMERCHRGSVISAQDTG